MTTEKLHFKTSSGIKSIVGKDLITDKFVAIFELVKNSYDAGAKQVTITFERDRIIIWDNGHGMSKQDLVEKWLNLAYSDKKEGRNNNDRAFVGSKGIGRFSADRLGRKLKITTKIKGESNLHKLLVDWEKFDVDLKKLFEKVELDYSFDKSLAEVELSYTKIEILDLNEVWTISEINKAKESLKRLKNPFVKDDGFKILVIDKNELVESEEIIESNIAEVLKDKSITIEGEFSEKIRIKLYDRGEKIYEVEMDNNSIIKDVPIFIAINYLTTSAKMTFSKRMKIAPVNYGNLFIYKNKFRVMPYGEMDFDTFGLNMRKTQGYSRYLGHREILGYMDIKDFNNSFFKEASSRDSGFVNNIYFEELRSLYLDYIHKPLEAFIHLVSWGEFRDEVDDILKPKYFDDADINEVGKFKAYVSKNKTIKYFKNDLNYDENNPQKKIEKIEKIAKDKSFFEIEKDAKYVGKKLLQIKKENTEKQKDIIGKIKSIQYLESQNKNLIKSKRPAESYTEQISHHLTDISSRLSGDIKGLRRIYRDVGDEFKEDLIKVINNLQGYYYEFKDFRAILEETNYDMMSEVSSLNWYEVAQWFYNRKPENDTYKVVISKLSNPLTKWERNTRVLDLTMFFENFYKNSKQNGAQFLNIEFFENRIIFSNNSNSIDEEYLNKIFELGFSTRKNGTGVGLYQVKEFLRSQNLEINVKNIDGLVVFEIF